ncbi:hypothetical protein HMPREF0519_1715 [Lentilactobacillus hilgardii DSM 20176 = ATCC 8290]|uniref:Uncharacterized protein n=1 Tax=Lentilactobacillus hilgardii (strain ATCC 8290 / DSM 20176 / CCUG 30140 / JCM 1155 / KCTC 3500 / NBRC 15886 / NCIMB 8040 / NRRL B-1843 / 9) TaxID=1423757 RepID=C0XKF4_LENH9|nr:hypothetical protein HMPREF0519_1715 [Lentilactobacillus hilgardii DSM 20176 = ATCC 8290]
MRLNFINVSKDKHNPENKACFNVQKGLDFEKNMVGSNSIHYYLACKRMCFAWITEFQ